jgi:hypothetical protein
MKRLAAEVGESAVGDKSANERLQRDGNAR